MKMDALEQVLQQHKKVAFIYTIADFQNPTGRCMSVERRKKLVELAETYDTFVVEDGPYSLISFGGQVMPAIKSFDTYGRVIYSGSTSKTIAPGLRIGWLIADHESITKLVYLKMRDDLQVNNIAQRQVYHYLKDCDFDGHLKTVIDVYRRRRDVMAEAVRASFPEGTRSSCPAAVCSCGWICPKAQMRWRCLTSSFKRTLPMCPVSFSAATEAARMPCG